MQNTARAPGADPSELAPQAAAFRDTVLAELGPREGGMDRPIDELRRDARELAQRYNGTPEPVAAIEEIDADGVRARLYRPHRQSAYVLVWFHGGAWMLGELDDDDALACGLVNRAGCNVVSVDYRLAPEHPYPAAINDCWVATKWALGNFDDVAVGGDSAGGNLAAAVALRARDCGIKPALQLLVYPALDAGLRSSFLTEFVSRYDDFGGDTGFGENAVAALRHLWDVYIPDPKRQSDVDASPLRTPSVAGVAPALIILAEHDPLRGEGEAYARRLQEEDVQVELEIYPGQIHGFYHLLGAIEDGWTAIEHTAATLRRAFDHQEIQTRAVLTDHW